MYQWRDLLKQKQYNWNLFGPLPFFQRFKVNMYIQGSKGIIQCTDNLMYIHNKDTQNYPFYRLQLVVDMFGHST